MQGEDYKASICWVQVLVKAMLLLELVSMFIWNGPRPWMVALTWGIMLAAIVQAYSWGGIPCASETAAKPAAAARYLIFCKKIIKDAQGKDDIERFVEEIVSPVTFVSLELKDGVFILTAGTRSKAALLGRNKRRLLELAKIIDYNFGKDLRII